MSRLAIATPHRLASEAGAAAFRAGGTAVDAALAAAAVLAVVAPQDCALGGDAFALVALPGGEVHAVNGSGAAAAAVDPAAVRARHDGTMPIRGPDTRVRTTRAGAGSSIPGGTATTTGVAPTSRAVATSAPSAAVREGSASWPSTSAAIGKA